MPRAFLVKKMNITNAKKNWSQLPDSVRGDIYIPCECHNYVNEDLNPYGAFRISN